MRDFIDFCLVILDKLIGCMFSLDMGGYSFGSFLVAVVVISVFVSSLVIRFRSSDVSSVTRPPKPKKKKKPKNTKKKG